MRYRDTKKVEIQKAGLKDINKVENIYKKTYIDEYKTQYPKKSNQAILKRRRDSKKRIQNFRKGTYGKNWILLIIKEKSKIIGFGQAHIKNSDKEIGMVDKLYVLKEYRRMKNGERLTMELINWLKKKRVKEIEVNILVKNNASIKNFAKQGFEKSSYVMRKKLK